MDVALNQTMYETFFNSLGILIGFLQAAIFQFTLDAKWKDKEKHKLTIRMLFVVQEVLLLSFFYSLIYIHYFGTYVIRSPESIDSINSFTNIVGGLNGFNNILILVCILAIFLFNLFLLMQELKAKVFLRSVVILVFFVFLAYVIWLTWKLASPIYIEKPCVMEIIKGGTPCYHLFVGV